LTPSRAWSADLAAENARLKRELARVKMERDVLKRTIGIFAQMPK
jgi:transposase